MIIGEVQLPMFCKHLLVYINSKVPFHEDLPPLPSHRSGVPANAPPPHTHTHKDELLKKGPDWIAF